MSAAAARALLHPCTRSVAPRRQWPRDRARPARIKQSKSRSVLRPGPTGPRRSDPEGQGQRASSAAGYWQIPSRFSADTWGQRPGWGEGHERDTAEEGRPPGLRGIPERRGAGGRSRLHPPLRSRPLPITLPVGFLSLSPPPTGSRAGARSESRLAGVSCVLRSRSSLQVGMEKRQD